MHRRHILAGILAGAALVCGSAGCAASETAPLDGLPASSAGSAGPTPGPALFTTKVRTMVIDDGVRAPQLCIGGVQESLPPQCAGLDLEEWDWGVVGEFEQRGDVRWGRYVVTGEYAAVHGALRVTDATPHGPDIGTVPEACADPSSERASSADVMNAWAYAEEDRGLRVFAAGDSAACGTVEVTVAYDDGSGQQAFDAEFGRGAVILESALSRIG